MSSRVPILTALFFILSTCAYLALLTIQKYRIDDEDGASFPTRHPKLAIFERQRYGDQAARRLRLAQLLQAVALIIALLIVFVFTSP